MKLTYYGHACFAVEVVGKSLLFDPFVTPNPLAKEIDVNEIKADFILVSHGHEDHVADVIATAQRTGATVIAPYEVGDWFESKKGLKNVQAMNHGGAAATDFGRVKLTSAIHSSSLPDGSYGGNPCGFVIETADGNFYYSGDTALTLDRKLVGDQNEVALRGLPDRRLLHDGNRRSPAGGGSRRRDKVCRRPLRHLSAHQAGQRRGFGYSTSRREGVAPSWDWRNY